MIPPSRTRAIVAKFEESDGDLAADPAEAEAPINTTDDFDPVQVARATKRR